MKSLYSKGFVVKRTAPAGGVTSGVPVQIGDQLVVPIADAAVGEQFEGLTQGTFRLPKSTAASSGGSEGDKVYWTTASDHVSAVSTGGILIGCYAEDRVDGDSQALVFLDGAIR